MNSLIDKQSMVYNDHFNPSIGLRNEHVQTVFSSVAPRRWLVSVGFQKYRQQQQEVILDCGEDSRLQGFYNQAAGQTSSKLLIMIHGWEGCHESTYMLSAAQAMLDNGVDVFRLNLRDHGATHHLNRGLFYSTLIEEVMNAIELIQQKFDYQEYHLAGFSLGGNFALRVAVLAEPLSLRLSKVIAFCPVIHAGDSNGALNDSSNWFYNQYFTRRWRRSLLAKASHWPEYDFEAELAELKNLNEMNLALVPKYAGFKTLDDYFDAYAVDGDYLKSTIAPCFLHFAADDMIIPISGVASLAENADIEVSVSRYGGHCGFIQNWRGQCWQNERLIDLIVNS